MEKRGTTGCNFDSGVKPLICEEDLHSEERPPDLCSHQSRQQVFTYIMTPWKHCRPAAMGLTLLAAVLLIVDISLGVHYNKLKDTHLTLDDTKRIANELTELQGTYKTAIKSINNYKKQLDSETSRQTETNWEFEHQTKRSTDYEAKVVQMTKDIEELKNPQPMIQDGCKRCLPGWILMNSVCYFFSLPNNAGYMTWQKAREFCQTHGGDLAIIDSKDKENSTVNHLRTHQKNVNSNMGFWIGLNDNEERGMWKWLDGRIMVEGYWMDGEPNNLDDEICVGVYPKTNFFKAWNDVRCDAKINWICEKAPAYMT